jgi:hypothetical protein
MGILLIVLGALALTLAAGAWLATTGFRNGDRPLDAVVTAQLREAGQPDETRPVVIAEVRNPSASALMVGLTARRSRMTRAWPGGSSVGVPRRSTRRALRAGQHETVGIVPARGSARFDVPVTAAGKRYLLTAAVGQQGGRLRVHRLLVDERARLWLPVADLTGWSG